MAFACVYVLAQQVDPISAKNTGKERTEAGFRLFWNNINRLLVDYQSLFYNNICSKALFYKNRLD
jgi:hypothetical protein